ncbi:MAG: cation-translocating P-type ATPase [Streptococcaceae bacterium]|jgi:Cd2+/Zn2+-exporting ATPase|nr:cation-translocating P-type ATPase [Streptococcaceae bacterium]
MFKFLKKNNEACQDTCCQEQVAVACSCPDCQETAVAESGTGDGMGLSDDDDGGDDPEGDSGHALFLKGAQSAPRAYRYQVSGMDCGACALTIQKSVAALPTVESATVNFSAGKMTVTTASQHTAQQQILKQVQQLGYSAHLISDQRQEVEKKGAPYKRVLLATVSYGLALMCQLLFKQTNLANLFFSLTILVAGFKIVKSAWFSLKAKSLDMTVLMSSAAIGAVLLGELSEAATVLYLFVLGLTLQTRAVTQTRQSIKALMSLAPSQALLAQDGEWVQVAVTEVQAGQTILVRSGDKVALDGLVIKGTTEVDQSAITGESMPVYKTVGSAVYAGSLNQSGSIEVRVSNPSSASTLARISALVEAAEASRAPSEAFIDRFARVYTPVVFLMAILTMVVPSLFFAIPLREAVFKGIELLIVACPCALVIATPVSLVSAIGNAAKNGVLIKGGAFLEKAAKVTAIAFDKTGTLTTGLPVVTAFELVKGTRQEVLSIASSLEAKASHPLAKAILAFTRTNKVERLVVQNHQTILGKGVSATIAARDYLIGSAKLFDLSAAERALKASYEATGHTVIFVGRQTEVMGIFLVKDTLRQSSLEAIKRLKTLGIQQLVMLTGDNHQVAANIAKQVGVTDFVAEMMPEDKAAYIAQLGQTAEVAMVGDGINDAPALATSDLGIAMGGIGTDTAMETADIVLMADNLNKLPFVFRLSRASNRVIKWNIALALSVKLAALFAIFAGILPIWLAVLSDTGMAVLVTLNALRLLRVKDHQSNQT